MTLSKLSGLVVQRRFQLIRMWKLLTVTGKPVGWMKTIILLATSRFLDNGMHLLHQLFLAMDASPASVSAQTVNTETLDTVVTITYSRHNVTQQTPTEGEVVITYVDKNRPNHILGTVSVSGARGSLVVVMSAI